MSLIFLSGPHGSGKTTLLNRILAEIPDTISPELKTTTSKFDVDPKDRRILKICQRILENFEYLQIAERNPEKIVLGNRCIYDNDAYTLAYHARGWITQEELERYERMTYDLYLPQLQEPLAIVLNPPFPVVKAHLEKRWQEKGKKWRENDLEYLAAACDAYTPFKDKPNVHYINHEIDLSGGKDVQEIAEWFQNLKTTTEMHTEVAYQS
ncbi:MAG: deoxynucleoside kinase [Nanoarchaeota archaeon]